MLITILLVLAAIVVTFGVTGFFVICILVGDTADVCGLTPEQVDEVFMQNGFKELRSARWILVPKGQTVAYIDEESV
jgi:hypothetical protein